MARKLSPEKRENYLQAALKLFAAHGVQHTSTAAISREAGTAAGTLFLYFPTKQNLIDELVLKISTEQSTYVNRLLDPDASAQESFAAIWEGSIRWFLTNRDAYRFVHQERDSKLVDEEIIRQTETHLSYYYAAIEKGLAEGKIKPYSPELIGGFIYHGVAAVVNLCLEQPDMKQQNAYIQQGFDIFWGGIQKEKATD
ncbi:MAG: TetR/AcrR family transcriptional regulator [Ardenticatenaceae bacterium]|nr:TetR/AcrR family transcriptional regulator [Ardenticatenaceae bacterium]